MTDASIPQGSPFPTETITGYPFSTATLAETIELLTSWLRPASTGRPEQRPARFFVCANPHSLEIARQDALLHEAIMSADLVTPDGAGIVLASRLLEGRIPERVCGPDLFPQFCAYLNSKRPGTRMFFLGSTEDNLGMLEQRFRADYPALDLRGSLSPPFRAEFSAAEDDALIDQVNASNAEILWLGLGAPKQEKWAHRHRDRLQVDLIGPIGGAFDWYTGRIALPPLWMQRAGLQWLHRLAQEPGRLWRRNLDSPIFLGRVLAQRFGSSRRGGNHTAAT
jgi:N-acetylglucosaminyldiphosphoundecaprenol N-acetyl-beta-D-mannosaminyltransferase